MYIYYVLRHQIYQRAAVARAHEKLGVHKASWKWVSRMRGAAEKNRANEEKAIFPSSAHPRATFPPASCLTLAAAAGARVPPINSQMNGITPRCHNIALRALTITVTGGYYVSRARASLTLPLTRTSWRRETEREGNTLTRCSAKNQVTALQESKPRFGCGLELSSGARIAARCCSTTGKCNMTFPMQPKDSALALLLRLRAAAAFSPL